MNQGKIWVMLPLPPRVHLDHQGYRGHAGLTLSKHPGQCWCEGWGSLGSGGGSAVAWVSVTLRKGLGLASPS